MNTRNDLSFQDELMLEGVALQAMTDVNKFYSKERVEHSAVHDDRVQLARELHDGVLQMLTAANLQLDQASRLLVENPQIARKRVSDAQELLIEAQRELRARIQTLKPIDSQKPASGAELAAALRTWCQRAEQRWNLIVRLGLPSEGSVPRALGDGIFRIVQEGICNVARHAHASAAHVDVEIQQDSVRVVVADDGIGFPFYGRFELAQLNADQRGPTSLKERVATLHGKLVLTSTPSGSRLVISLPVQRPQVPAWKTSRRI